MKFLSNFFVKNGKKSVNLVEIITDAWLTISFVYFEAFFLKIPRLKILHLWKEHLKGKCRISAIIKVHTSEISREIFDKVAREKIALSRIPGSVHFALKHTSTLLHRHYNFLLICIELIVITITHDNIGKKIEYLKNKH